MSRINRKTITSRLVHSIIILENVAQSKIDEPVWQEMAQTFAEINPLSDCNYTNLEGFNFGNFITEEYYLFRVRYMEGLNKNMRIKYRQKLYSIKRIININQKNKILNIITHEIG